MPIRLFTVLLLLFWAPVAAAAETITVTLIGTGAGPREGGRAMTASVSKPSP